MNREQALIILHKYIKKESLANHMLSVEAAMRFYAEKFNEDIEKWGICGLLHDFDYEVHPTLEQHPQDGAVILREHSVPEDIILAVLSHAPHTGVPRDDILRKTLYACDEVTGLITACVLVRPSKSIYDLEVKSVRKKWKDKLFAAGANRDEMEEGARELGIDLWEHVDNVILAMRKIAPQISLSGSPTGEEN
ncbi:MAG: HDIG domain-containing protein [Chloroflexi bacterium]|nr:HDIG domain-containing protein [Chloroflexota bacterium]